MVKNQPPSQDLRIAFALEAATLGWNIVGTFVLVMSARAADSVALLGFALDSFLEIGASAVVIWELSARDGHRRVAALPAIGWAFAALAVYLVAQSFWALATGHRAEPSSLGLAWTALTAGTMFVLAMGKSRIGARLRNPVVLAEGKVTLIDALLACGVFLGLALNATVGAWWADAAVGLGIAIYAAREASALLTDPGELGEEPGQ